MNKCFVDPFDYATQIVKANPKGILLTSAADGEVDTMTIGWGMIGNEWGTPMFIAFVRTGRYTHQLIEKNPQFTINVPDENTDKKILGYAGTKSLRDCDKIADLGLTLVEGEKIQVPGIAELPLTLECEVIYKQDQVIADMLPEIQEKYYPDLPSTVTGANRDTHTAIYGRIVSAYIIEK